jgi:hypothetical protein
VQRFCNALQTVFLVIPRHPLWRKSAISRRMPSLLYHPLQLRHVFFGGKSGGKLPGLNCPNLTAQNDMTSVNPHLQAPAAEAEGGAVGGNR